MILLMKWIKKYYLVSNKIFNLEKIFQDDKFGKYWSTLKETSKGGKTGGECLCENTKLKVFNIDTYIKSCYKEYNFQKIPARPDAIYFDNTNPNIYFIEFKNSKNIDSKEIKNKMKSGYDIFKKLTELDSFDNKYKFYFLLVGKENTSKQIAKKEEEIRNHNRKNIPKYNLADINKNECNNFFTDIFTHSVDYYKKIYSDLKC